MSQMLSIESALRIVRVLMANGLARDEALSNPAIPGGLRDAVAEILQREETFVLSPARVVAAEANRALWLTKLDRSVWYYWPTLRDYLLNTKGWLATAVRSLDEATDGILGQVSDPAIESFDIRGLVIGYVQSGKTANFTALIAKAADVGFKLIIVLSGLDNGLRRQTQVRLDKELVGHADGRAGSVPLPPRGRQWAQFTTDSLSGDFQAGHSNHSALQGSQPVLLVIKKNRDVLLRLHAWLDAAPDEMRRALPLLLIDDEADQGSVDTRGDYIGAGQVPDEDTAPPSVINGLIRSLLQKFERRAYVAYTATPFANILIPHDAVATNAGGDLYPKDFIIDLPKPAGYFGTEELFGRQDPATGEHVGGIDAIRQIPEDDAGVLSDGKISRSLEDALIDFVLAGAARAERGQGDQPATMLVHTSREIQSHDWLWQSLSARFAEIRDEWRYQRDGGIRELLRSRWETGFRPVTLAGHARRDRSFTAIEEHVGPFLEAIGTPRQINSATGEMLDYEREPGLKAIAVGGNKLSRGLTLEGLTVSYFVRSTLMYDTLMQMGRWFGFRRGYEDLTRIYMSSEMAGYFSDLARVEHELRQDIRRYESEGLTPLELGPRIREHHAMLITSAAKARHSTSIIVDRSFSNKLVQTVRFPFSHPDRLAQLLSRNLSATGAFVEGLGRASSWDDSGPIWKAVSAATVLHFLEQYHVDPELRNIWLEPIRRYISRHVEHGELIEWTVAIRGRKHPDDSLGEATLEVEGGSINMISRTRLRGDPDSLGVVTGPGDEATGLSDTERQIAQRKSQGEGGEGINPAARGVRSPKEGLLLIYPVSRYSGIKETERGARRPLHDETGEASALDVIALALSFPRSALAPEHTSSYALGTVGWKAE